MLSNILASVLVIGGVIGGLAIIFVSLNAKRNRTTGKFDEAPVLRDYARRNRSAVIRGADATGNFSRN